MDDNRAVRRFMLELSPPEVPCVPVSLLDDINFESVEDAIPIE